MVGPKQCGITKNKYKQQQQKNPHRSLQKKTKDTAALQLQLDMPCGSTQKTCCTEAAQSKKPKHAALWLHKKHTLHRGSTEKTCRTEAAETEKLHTALWLYKENAAL